MLALLLTGCATKDPYAGVYWAEASDGFPALCTADGKRCFQPSDQDREYFRQQMCGPGQSAI